MERARFRLQAAIVLILITLVGWPQMRPVRATSVWRVNGPLEPQRPGVTDRRLDYGDNQRARAGYGSRWDQDTRASASPNDRLQNDDSPDNSRRYDTSAAEMASIGARLNGIIGRARTSLNAPVPYARLILRNLITGQIEARAVADQEGRFTFIDVGASGYIIELIGPDGTVIASSETVALADGDLKQATVRVASAATLQSLYGNVVAPSAGDPLRTAVDTGVRSVITPAECVSAGRPCLP